MLLEKLLVLGLEVLIQNHAADLPTLFAETLLRAEVGEMEGRIVGQLPGAADAGMERLVTDIADVASVAIEQARWPVNNEPNERTVK